jgi:peptide/nickel transport system permease protein
MGQYILKRILLMIPTLVIISIVSFIIIQLPPGDYLTSVVANLEEQGQTVDNATLASLQKRYGLGQPVYVQYWKWISGILLRGDFGRSFRWNLPVSELIWSRLGMTFLLSFTTLMFSWIIALPIGIYTAVKQHSPGDYIATFIGFIGLAIPNFLLALVLMYIAFKYFNQSVGGLFSPEMMDAPWSFARIWDLLKHLWIPVVVLGTAGTAGLIRIMRANLLDELKKTYVMAARARGLKESTLLRKYPVRVALNPFVSTIGWSLPTLVSGATVTAIVLSLPTTGPLLIGALKSQDMFLAGGFILMLSTLTVIGTLLSDILLAAIDPRIRYSKKG